MNYKESRQIYLLNYVYYWMRFKHIFNKLYIIQKNQFFAFSIHCINLIWIIYYLYLNMFSLIIYTNLL